MIKWSQSTRRCGGSSNARRFIDERRWFRMKRPVIWPALAVVLGLAPSSLAQTAPPPLPFEPATSPPASPPSPSPPPPPSPSSLPPHNRSPLRTRRLHLDQTPSPRPLPRLTASRRSPRRRDARLRQRSHRRSRLALRFPRPRPRSLCAPESTRARIPPKGSTRRSSTLPPAFRATSEHFPIPGSCPIRGSS